MRTFSAVLVILSVLVAPAGAGAETVRVAGTGGATELMRRVGTAFTTAEGVAVEVQSRYGSDGAIKALAAGALDVAVAARPLKAAESANGSNAVPFARTPLVFVTSHPAPNPVRATDLPAIFANPAPTWADGSPLRIILRTRLDADTMLLGDYFPGLGDAIETARGRPDAPVAATDQDNFDLASRIAGSFVQAGLAQVVTERPKLTIVPLDGVTPTLAALEQGLYPYEKHFFLVLPARPSPAAERLLAFLRSPAGQAALRDNGCLPFGW